jgi:diguanylate cyclase (GGDEF)-like protein/PAS domain S-box-containing protein
MNPSQFKSSFVSMLKKPVSVMVVATLFVVLVCVSLVVLDAWRTWQARDIEMHDAEVVASNLAHSLAQHAEDVVLNSDMTLMNLVDRIEEEGLGPTERARLYSLMSTEVADSPWLHGLFVYDENGNWIVNSQAEHVQKLNNADREYFIYHRNNRDRGPYIGVPVRSRSTSEWIITVSRRINHPDGSFAGVALASISMDYFLRFYSSFDIGNDGAIDLLLDNGTLLVRRPFLESKVGTSIAKGRLFSEFLRKSWTGTATFKSSLDGMERMNAYQHVENYPLVVDVAMSEDEILAKWRKEAYLNTAGVGILVIVFGILGFRMIGHIRRRLVVERALSESEERLRTITDTMPAYISYIDHEQRYRFCNAQYLTTFNQRMDQLLGSSLHDLFGDEAYATIEPYVKRALAGEKVVFERQALERGSGCYSLYHYVPDLDRHGKVRGFYAMVLDITPRKTAELKLGAKEKLLRGLTDHLPALVSYIDRDEIFQFNNQPYEQWLNKPLSEITGKHVREACGDEAYFKYKRFFDEALAGKKTDFAFARERDGVKHYYTSAYIPQFDEDGQVVGVCSMINDITDLKKVELQLIKLARFDSLTGLPNRIQFDESLRKAMARSRRGGLAMALMYLDIDHFKTINDTYGHQAGDEALIEFSIRLAKSVRKTDQVARLSGDEFVIILEEMKSVEEAEIVARKVIHAMEPEFVLGATRYQVSTSIGIAVLRADDNDPQALLRRADQALYRAKHGGRNAYRLDEAESEPT